MTRERRTLFCACFCLRPKLKFFNMHFSPRGSVFVSSCFLSTESLTVSILLWCKSMFTIAARIAKALQSECRRRDSKAIRRHRPSTSNPQPMHCRDAGELVKKLVHLSANFSLNAGLALSKPYCRIQLRELNLTVNPGILINPKILNPNRKSLKP